MQRTLNKDIKLLSEHLLISDTGHPKAVTKKTSIFKICMKKILLKIMCMDVKDLVEKSL